MERKKELPKLINVLRQTGRMAMRGEWMGSDKDPAAAAYCAGVYNRVFERLKEGDEGAAAVFDALPPDSSLTVIAIACDQLAAYYEDELETEPQNASASDFEESASFKDF